LTASDTGERRMPVAPPSPGDFASEPVQAGASRVKGRMSELMEAVGEPRVGADTDGPATPVPGRPGAVRFGVDAVPLRPASERDAEVEQEERRRLVAAGSRRRSPLRRHRRLLVLGAVVIGLVVPAAVQITNGGNDAAPERIESKAAASASRNQSSRPSPPGTRAVSGRRAPFPRAGRHGHGAGRQRGQGRPPNRHGRAHHGVPPDTSQEVAAEPAPEPEAAPAPEPEATPAPEPGSTPATAAPGPTSSPEGKTTGQSQVEAQFGFEK
jgi:hypothetical protein